MQIKILAYRVTDREKVQAFVDVQIGNEFRLNGLHLMRDGTLQSAKLTPLIAGQRVFIPAIEVLDANLRESLTTALLAAIREHVAALSPKQRSKAPRPPENRPAKAPAGAQVAPPNGKPARRIILPAIPEKPKLRPPVRLLANFSRRP
jgi:hypothetical protein